MLIRLNNLHPNLYWSHKIFVKIYIEDAQILSKFMFEVTQYLLTTKFVKIHIEVAQYLYNVDIYLLFQLGNMCS